MEYNGFISVSMKKLGIKLINSISNASRFIYLILLVTNSLSNAAAPSLDTNNPLIFEDIMDGDSYFGYSVLLYSEHGKRNSWIQIGAPRANLSHVGQRDIFEPGAVYRCQLSPLQLCKPLMVSGKGEKLEKGEERRDGSWMGAAMDVQPGPDGQLVICSPRWEHNISSYYMPGACYWGSADADGWNTFDTLLPLLDIDQYSKTSSTKAVLPFFAFGEAGLSVHFPLVKPIEANSKLVIGVPGLYNWKGGFVYYEGAPSTHHRGSSSKLRVPSVGIDNFQDSDYTGYQVNSGYFFKKKVLLFVLGAPRAEAAAGKVRLVYIKEKHEKEFSINVRLEISGIQCGEYFGASIAVGDLNQDSYDDLIVGAPLYSNDDVMLPDYDRGRIAIYLSVPTDKEKGNQEKPSVIETESTFGYKAGGRFGSAVAFLGDINSDGIPEVAVGAPYEDENRGAVYIYSCSRNGRLGNPIQRIAAKDSYDPMKGFGISISPHNVDIDGNGCPDVAIGAYLSGHAVIYRGKPVIHWLIINPETPSSISHSATHFFLESACVTYVGTNAPNTLKIRRRIELDKRCKEQSITDTIEVRRGVQLCHNFTIPLKPNIRDLLNPIEIIISYELLKAEEDTKHFILIKRDEIHGKDSFCAQCPVSAISPTEMLTIPFSVSCGADSVCTADLSVSGELPELKKQSMQESFQLVTGSSETLLLQLIVSNKDEVDTAYFTRVYISIGVPGSLSRFLTECREISRLPFLNYTHIHENSTDNFLNSRLKPSFIECETGDISPKERKNISIELDVTNVQGYEEMRLAAWATTVNNETYPLDNVWEGKVQLNNEADIAIFGKGIPEISSISLEGENETESQISFIHQYEVQKFGFSQVQQASIEIHIPMYITDMESDRQIKFLTLTEYKGFLGRQTLSCSFDDSVDKEDEIKIIRKRSAVNRTSDMSRSEATSNRTLYFNCSSPLLSATDFIECRTVSCILGPLKSSQTIAKVSLKMEINVQKLKHLMGTRHIVFLNTHGLVKVIAPANLLQPPNDKSDEAMVHSLFVASAPKKKIETWIYAVAIGGGIMIVLFLQMALAKAGFFKRKKKDELKALKRQTLMMISEEFLQQQRLREVSEDSEREDKQESVI